LEEGWADGGEEWNGGKDRKGEGEKGKGRRVGWSKKLNN
jgi:hypothetical protein